MIEIVMVVVTLAIPGHVTRVVNAEWPFFRSMAECQKAVAHMRDAPPIADRIECEFHMLDVSTGRVVR
jgi:hypothetical protein